MRKSSDSDTPLFDNPVHESAKPTETHRLFDGDGDGHVTSTELFSGMFSQIFDTNDDDLVCTEELMHVLANFGDDVSPEVASRMIELATEGKSREVDREQFVSIMQDVSRGERNESKGRYLQEPAAGSSLRLQPTAVEVQADKVKGMFEQIDLDGSGTLDHREVSKLSKLLGNEVKKRHLVDAMSAMDPEGTGEVTLDMFRDWWGERHRHWTELLVLPESLVELVIEEAGENKELVTSPLAMWGRLSHLLLTLVKVMEERADVFGLDPSNLYGGSKDDEEIVDEHEIELEAKLKHCFLHPNSKIRETWDAVQALLLIYVLFVVPFRTCFGLEIVLGSPTFFLELCIDIYFLVDIFLNFRTGFYDMHTGDLRIDQRSITAHYMKGWFTVDVASCFPANYIAYIYAEESNSGMRSLKVLRMLRLMKMLRMFRVAQLLERYDEFIRPFIASMRLVVMVLLLMMLCHGAACIWYMIGIQTQIFDDGTSVEGWALQQWDPCSVNMSSTVVTADAFEGFLNMESKHVVCDTVPIYVRYITSIYWAISTLSTVGYGDISANTSVEMLLCFFAEITGVMVFGILSGMLSKMAFVSKGAEQKYEDQMDYIRSFLDDKEDLTTGTKRRVLAFYEKLWRGKVVYDQEEIVGRLPDCLRVTISRELFREMGTASALFARLDEDLRYRLCICMKHTVALHRDCIIREGTVGEHIYIIEAGEVDVLKQRVDGLETLKLGRLGRHAFFGELAVLGRRPMPYARSVRARTFVRLAVLSKEALDYQRAHYPELDAHMNSFMDRARGQLHTVPSSKYVSGAAAAASDSASESGVDSMMQADAMLSRLAKMDSSIKRQHALTQSAIEAQRVHMDVRLREFAESQAAALEKLAQALLSKGSMKLGSTKVTNPLLLSSEQE